MAKGWIKTYRDITDHWVYQDNLRFKAWMDLLLRANHKGKRIRFNKGFIDIKKGQTITSLQKLADSWLCSRNTVSTILKEFESDGMIEVNSSKHGTLITIVKYSDFQGVQDTDCATDCATDYATDCATDCAQTRMIKNDTSTIQENKKTASPVFDPGGYEIEE